MAGEAGGTRVVLTTLPDADAAERLARQLVEERLAACGNVVAGLVSLYRWKGEVERAAEALVILKTTDEVLPALLARLPELHPYQVPELLALPVAAGHEPYLWWVAEETRPREGR